MSYIGLHQHSVGSLLDGYSKVSDICKRANELGWTHACLTDHNHVLLIPELIQQAEKYNVIPILGCELYFTPDARELTKPIAQRKEDAAKKAVATGEYFYEQISRFKKKEWEDLYKKFGYNTKDYHILFMAKDKQGWNNLIKLQSEAVRLGLFNGRYHTDWSMLEQYHEGLICTSACVGSYPAQQLAHRHPENTIEYIDRMQQIFGDDFYLEIQPHNFFLQYITNKFYMEYAEEHRIKTVGSNDSHWTYKNEAEEHDVLLCIGTGQKLSTPRDQRMAYDPVYWIRDQDEMLEAFEEQCNDMLNSSILSEDSDASNSIDKYIKFYSKAVNMPSEIADKIEPNIKIGSDHSLFPAVKVPEGSTPEKELVNKAFHGLGVYLEKNPELDKWKYMRQLCDELEVINPKGFAPYFLAVEEYTTWCREQEIPVGPGRGSAAGSLVLFSIGVTTNIDPIKDKLMFSRFLTADRKESPDIDLDFSWLHRDRVIKHLEDYYGKDHVSHIGTIMAMKVKTSIKDCCRVLGIDFKESLNISKEIDALSDDPNLSFEKIDSWAEEEPEKYNIFHKLEEKYSQVFYYARKFEGIPRQIGIHASGILVTPDPIIDYFPVRYIDGTAITLWDGPTIESMGGVKLDILGLRNLDCITYTLKNIELTTGKHVTLQDLYDTVNREDPNIYKMIREKKTEGIFQIESNLMKGLADKIGVDRFEDLAAMVSIARPGPLAAHADDIYANGKNGIDLAPCPLHGCEDIFENTYNAIIYQEQLMKVSQRIAGFNDTQADSLTRKCTAKKKPEMMYMLQRIHKYGKKNEEGPEGWETNDDLPWYDPKKKYGAEIKGAVANGYTPEEIDDYFNSIEAFCSYAFNQSHCDCYSYIAVLTAWLKYYYPTEFFAANLSVFSGDEDRRIKYAGVAKEQFKIELKCPDINISRESFTPHGKEILYGLSGLKGIGPAKIPGILKARKDGPFESLEDAMKRIPKASFSKTAGESLIKAGAFDWENPNRYIMLNKFYDLRKDKPEKVPRYDPEEYNDSSIIAFEREILGVPITVIPWWDQLKDQAQIKNTEFTLKGRRPHTDKKGRPMLFCTGTHDGIDIDCVIFASTYTKAAGILENKKVLFSGKKDGNKFIVSEVKIAPK